MTDLLKDDEFLRLEKDFKFLSRAREMFEQKLNELEKESYVVVDIETTGLDPALHEIIEIGALKVEAKEIKDIFNTLISPNTKISEEITNLTGITDNLLANQPALIQVLPKFIEFIGNSPLIAHNTDFDIEFLKYHIAKLLGKEIKNESVCTVKIARALFPNLENHKLHTVANYFKLETPNRHRALGDAEITYYIFCRLLDELKKKNINTKDELVKFLAQFK